MKKNLFMFDANTGSTGGTPPIDVANGEQTPPITTEPIQFANQSELDSAMDKHTTKALETREATLRAEFQKAQEEAIQKALADAKRAENMTPEEIQMNEVETLRKELAQQKAENAKMLLREKGNKLLEEKKVSSVMSPFLEHYLVDEESLNEGIKLLEEAQKEMLKQAGNELLAKNKTIPKSFQGENKTTPKSRGERLAEELNAKNKQKKYFS